MSKLSDQLKKDEGFSSVVYKCPTGHCTIGYGYNLDVNPLKLDSNEVSLLTLHGIPEHEAERLLKLMIDQIEKRLSEKLSFWDSLDNVRQDVLINMTYNLGINGMLKFKDTLHAIEIGDYTSASNYMLKSLWAKQVKNRAKRLSKNMLYGHY